MSLQEQTLAIRKEFKALMSAISEYIQIHQVPLDSIKQVLHFHSLKDQTEIQTRQVPLDSVKQVLHYHSPKDQETSIEDIFCVAAAEGYWCFFKYDILIGVTLVSIGHALLDKQQEYDTHFVEYCKRRLRKFPSDGAAVEEKVVFLMDNKMHPSHPSASPQRQPV